MRIPTKLLSSSAALALVASMAPMAAYADNLAETTADTLVNVTFADADPDEILYYDLSVPYKVDIELEFSGDETTDPDYFKGGQWASGTDVIKYLRIKNNSIAPVSLDAVTWTTLDSGLSIELSEYCEYWGVTGTNTAGVTGDYDLSVSLNALTFQDEGGGHLVPWYDNDQEFSLPATISNDSSLMNECDMDPVTARPIKYYKNEVDFAVTASTLHAPFMRFYDKIGETFNIGKITWSFSMPEPVVQP